MRLFPLVLVAVFTQICEGARTKGVTASLETKWPSLPLHLEASEFLAQDSNSKFWGYVDDMTRLKPGDIPDLDESYYHLILKLAGRQLSSDLETGLLKLSLSTHSFSPKLEMWMQIAEDLSPPSSDCPVFVDVHGELSCQLDQLQSLLDSARDRARPVIYQVDHSYPATGSDTPPALVVLYGDMGNKQSNFAQFHQTLVGLAQVGRITYVLRHYVQEVDRENKVRLSGYGVELAIKSTEYKAVDDSKVKETESDEEGAADTEDADLLQPDQVNGFVFSKLKEKHPGLEADLRKFKGHLLDSSNQTLVPLKVWQLQDLSYQAAQVILLASEGEGLDSLKTMQDLSQNFPVQSRSLVKTVVKPEMQKEIENNQRVLASNLGLSPGEATILLNGLSVDPDTTDPYMLLDLMRDEAKLIGGLHALDFKEESIGTILETEVSTTSGNYAIDIRHPSVQYFNDLESDARYKGWSSSLRELLRPTWPGMLRQVARNMFHAVLVLDPAAPGNGHLVRELQTLLENGVPVRLGVVFVVSDQKEVEGRHQVGVAVYRSFNFGRAEFGPEEALGFLAEVYSRPDAEAVLFDDVEKAFAKHFKGEEDILEVVGSSSDYDDKRTLGAEFYNRSGLGSLPQVLLNGVPMDRDDLAEESFEDTLLAEILKATTELQKAVWKGELADHQDVLDFLMAKPNVLPGLNRRVLSDKVTQIDLISPQSSTVSVNDFTAFSDLNANEMVSVMMDSLKYLTKKDDLMIRPVTYWVVCDLNTLEGRTLLQNGLKHVKSSNTVRLGIVHNPAEVGPSSSETEHWLARAVNAAFATQTRNMAKNFIVKLLKLENFKSIDSGQKTVEDFDVHGMALKAFQDMYNARGGGEGKGGADLAFLQSHQRFSQTVLNMPGGQRAIVANGQIFGPLAPGEEFNPPDFELLEKFLLSRAAGSIKKSLKRVGLGEANNPGHDPLSTLAMKVYALLTLKPRQESRHFLYKSLKSQHSMVDIAPRVGGAPSFHLVAILDPLSPQAQKWSAILPALHQVANCRLQVYMNCQEKLSDLPLKRFYRYVLEPELRFRVDSSFSSGPVAKFSGLPEDLLLTLNMITPEGWLVESVRSPYDLDNIKLSEVGSSAGVHGEFELEYLLLEGHCVDSTSGQPPRGLQFTLGTKTNPVIVDTIVMANLGYFQLKANPGAWMLRMRKGRSEEIYDISSHEGTDSPEGASDVMVIMDSFKSKILKVIVNKKPDKVDVDLLADGDEEESGGGGIWESISSLTGSGKNKDQNGVAVDEDKTLNIFSIASGHLYERFLRIMMLSVLKHTKSPVKFWFLKNYLSPNFKNFIPHMAKEYGFEYELVQYKWPRWLHQQTEKQRLIWGYKILFLDVLFPLSVKKFIFVDADQIVRADLQELADLDLGGAPYGYTPFCDSRKEMDGFRFWKSGYWKSHMGGRKYHISALYVVDLKKFRRIAAGDRLRGQYQGLSQDPNSLSNLDQDLPNNMIHQVAIKSLPQEWLWCETWCSDYEKAQAKTIDLCNNPLTKEPKLTSAMRIVAEWSDYDNEIKSLQERVASGRNVDTTEPIKDEL